MDRLTTDGHRVTRLVRPESKARGTGGGSVDTREWSPSQGALDPRVFEGIDAVVHLGGASIGSVWTPSRKRLLRSSRIDTTRLLADRLAAARQDSRPATFVQAAAVGYYGDRGDELLTESSPPGTGFIADLCRDWESASDRAQDAGVRVVRLRTAPVLSSRGGLLPLLRRVFRLGLGGRLGSGRQWMPWSSLEDTVGVYVRALTDARLEGPINNVAPEPVTNEAFTRALARAVRRPAVLPVPALALRMLPGGMGREALLASERVVPKALLDAGHVFEKATLETVLATLP